MQVPRIRTKIHLAGWQVEGVTNAIPVSCRDHGNWASSEELAVWVLLVTTLGAMGQSYGWRRLKENRRKYFACCKTGISENNVARPAENWMDQRVKNLVCFKATEIQPAGNNH